MPSGQEKIKKIEGTIQEVRATLVNAVREKMDEKPSADREKLLHQDTPAQSSAPATAPVAQSTSDAIITDKLLAATSQKADALEASAKQFNKKLVDEKAEKKKQQKEALIAGGIGVAALSLLAVGLGVALSKGGADVPVPLPAAKP